MKELLYNCKLYLALQHYSYLHLDIKECDSAKLNKCSGPNIECVEKIPGYACMCQNNYTISSDGLSCPGKTKVQAIRSDTKVNIYSFIRVDLCDMNEGSMIEIYSLDT